MAADGRKVAHYGLLPKGVVHDWGGHRYHFCFTDGWTYHGMAAMALAFREAGLPEADRFVREAEEYRQCLRDVVQRTEYVDPATNLLFVPNTVYFRQGERGGAWVGDGPLVLFDAGVLDAATDKHWEPTLSMIMRHWGTLGGLICHFAGDLECADPTQVNRNSPLWYLNQTEMYCQRGFLARGEVEKALLVFYTNLVYGMSADCYETVERVNLEDANYAPFQPNSSGNGRVLAMIRRLVIDEQDEQQGVLWLLRGCPRRWFAVGKSIVVADAPTLFGKMAIRTHSTGDTVTVDLNPPTARPPRQVNVVVRHPGGQPPKKVEVTGGQAKVDGEVLRLSGLTGKVRIICTY